MPSFRLHPRLACMALCALWPTVAAAQEGSIAVSATVRPRPLALLGVSRTAASGELRLQIDGCGTGAISVAARSPIGKEARAAYVPLPAATACGVRSVTLQLAGGAAAGASAFVVSLEQADAMLSPSFSQFVVPASTLASGLRTTLAH